MKAATVHASDAMRNFDAPLGDILRWAEKPEDGSESTIVDLEVVNKNRDRENDEQRTAADAAASSDNRSTARAGRKRQVKAAKRVRLDFRLQPADRQALREIQDWVNDQIQRKAWTPEEGWKPQQRKEGAEHGTISYNTPVGWVENVPANSFRQMTNGSLAWIVPTPNPSIREQRKQAERLASLGFQETICRMCGKPLEGDDGPEMAQINNLLKGRFVLPYIHEPLAPGVEELRFRRLHLLHSVWEEKLVQIQLELDLVTTDELVEHLNSAIPEVLEDAKKRKPSTTESEVYVALDEVLAFWDSDKEGTNDVG